MHSMDSAKPALSVALADERLGTGWRRPRTAVRVVALLCSLLAAGVVFGLFNRFGIIRSEARPERQLIGTIDMGIAHRELGQIQARADIASGVLKLLSFGPAEPSAEDHVRAERLKKRYGVIRVSHGEAPTPQSQAYANGYNWAVKAEIKRRHGQDFLDRLLREFDNGSLRQDKAGNAS